MNERELLDNTQKQTDTEERQGSPRPTGCPTGRQSPRSQDTHIDWWKHADELGADVQKYQGECCRGKGAFQKSDGTSVGSKY